MLFCLCDFIFPEASKSLAHRDGDKPSTFLNEKTMEKYRPLMKTLYYDPSKYDNYLDQLGIQYPTVRTPAK